MTNVNTGSNLALLGGQPAVTSPAPAWPRPGNQEAEWMAEVVRSGQWSWLGPHERAFCEEYKRFIGTKYCVCMANGTVTLQCALQAVGVEPGDEVLVPALTWVATAQAQPEEFRFLLRSWYNATRAGPRAQNPNLYRQEVKPSIARGRDN